MSCAGLVVGSLRWRRFHDLATQDGAAVTRWGTDVTVRILVGDALAMLKTLEPESVQCCVTSPPYYGLRDYGVAGQLGLEATPDEYVARMVDVFREVRRVLRPDGTLWLNIGDSYAGSGKGGNPEAGKQATNRGSQTVGSLYETGKTAREAAVTNVTRRTFDGIKAKDLIGVPWLLAFALRADGWYLRSDIIWSKPNPMPESVTDRPTKAHEYVFLLSKSSAYFYDADAISEPVTPSTVERMSQPTLDEQEGSTRVPGKTNGNMKAVLKRSGNKVRRLADGTSGDRPADHLGRSIPWEGATRNKRTVWEITTQPFKESHFATMPPDLAETCIKAGSAKQACEQCGAPWERITERVSTGKRYSTGKSAEKNADNLRTGFSGYDDGSSAPVFKTIGFGPSCSCENNTGGAKSVVLDPFGGAGTTALVADRLGRDAILCELNPEYAKMAERRINGDAGMFSDVEVA
jgi:DNA modification methylase